jgi:hypothetical protein
MHSTRIGQRWDESDASSRPGKQKTSWEGHIYILRTQIEGRVTSHTGHLQQKPGILRVPLLWSPVLLNMYTMGRHCQLLPMPTKLCFHIIDICQYLHFHWGQMEWSCYTWLWLPMSWVRRIPQNDLGCILLSMALKCHPMCCSTPMAWQVLHFASTHAYLLQLQCSVTKENN